MDKGKAFEYTCARALAELVNSKHGLSASLEENSSLNIARNCFTEVEQQDNVAAQKLVVAAQATANFLARTEPKLLRTEDSFFPTVQISIQADAIGISGDVRDVLAVKRQAVGEEIWEIGLSCKHNHDAVKHQRISPAIDFGAQWLGNALNQEDFSELARIFNQIDADRETGHVNWNQIANKGQRYYMPSLQLIIDKIRSHPNQHLLANHLLAYLIGNHDFYKVIVHEAANLASTSLHILGFNLNGTLNQPTVDGTAPTERVARLRLPERVVNVELKPNSLNTLEIFFDGGWQISMRVHNATAILEKSLKMDVRLTGMPPQLFSQTITV